MQALLHMSSSAAPSGKRYTVSKDDYGNTNAPDFVNNSILLPMLRFSLLFQDIRSYVLSYATPQESFYHGRTGVFCQCPE